MNKEILKVIYGTFILLFVMPSLLALISTVGFWTIYLSLTHPILTEYQTQLTFRIGMLNVAFGVLFSQVIIVKKILDYTIGKNKK